MKENKIITYIALGIITVLVSVTLLWIYSVFTKPGPVVQPIVQDTNPVPVGYVPRDVVFEYRADGAFYRYEDEQIPFKFSAGISLDAAQELNLEEGQTIQIAEPYGLSEDRLRMLYSEALYPNTESTVEYYVIELETQRRYRVSLTNAQDPRTQHNGEGGIIERVEWSKNTVDVHYRVGAQRLIARSLDTQEPWLVGIEFETEEPVKEDTPSATSEILE